MKGLGHNIMKIGVIITMRLKMTNSRTIEPKLKQLKV